MPNSIQIDWMVFAVTLPWQTNENRFFLKFRIIVVFDLNETYDKNIQSTNPLPMRPKIINAQYNVPLR